LSLCSCHARIEQLVSHTAKTLLKGAMRKLCDDDVEIINAAMGERCVIVVVV
jgi:hypothetical protein